MIDTPCGSQLPGASDRGPKEMLSACGRGDEMMRNQGGLAFVLGGGGGRGALQVGALRALLEAGLQPDLLVGTSAGAVNATYLAMRGFNLETLESLEANWHAAAEADLLPANYLWLTVRLMFHHTGIYAGHRMRDFFISLGCMKFTGSFSKA